MIAPQSPSLQVFVWAQAVSAGDVAAQGFPPITAIEANHVVVADRLAHRDSGGKHFFDRSLRSDPTQRAMH